jgi:transposase
MSYVLSEEKRQQVLALGRLGWPLRRIEQETGVRRETASAYLKAAGIGVRPPGAWGRRPPAKPANEVTTGSTTEPSATNADINLNPNPNPENLSNKEKNKTANPANEVTTGSTTEPSVTNAHINPNPNPNPEDLSNKEKNKTANPANEVTTGFGVESSRLASQNHASTPSACEPFREAIELGLSRGRNAMAIWQDLVADCGFGAGYQTVKRFVRKLRGNQPAQARAVIITAPGEEAQVDYGIKGPMVRDPQTGKYRRTRLFVLTLGYSRKAVRLLTFHSSSRIWAELHEQAFRRLGGSTRLVVLDNLKEGVLVPDLYDPALNPLYRDLLAHYGAVALPCRINDPDRKGKVESGVGHAQRTPLKGMRFESLEQAQAYLDRWETRYADTRIHGTTKRQVAAMFAEEKPALLPLPLEPFRYYQHGLRVVHLDGCVEVEAAYYAPPPGWIGRQVQVQWDGVVVRILDPKTGQLLREHLRQKRGGYRIQKQDLSPRRPHKVSQLLWRAERAGTQIGALCHQIYNRQGQVGVRRIQGVLSLAKKYGTATTENACTVALEMGVPEYQFVRRYLERAPQLSLRQVDPLIRELVQYRDLINKKTKEPTS